MGDRDRLERLIGITGMLTPRLIGAKPIVVRGVWELVNRPS